MKKINSSKIRMLTGIGFLVAILGLSYGCSKSSMSYMSGATGSTGGTSAGPPANEVFIQGMAFTPPILTVTTNTAVKWTNKDAVTHNVTSSTDSFSSGPLVSGATYSFTFSKAGSYSYSCTIHPSMMGTIVVNDPMATPGY